MLATLPPLVTLLADIRAGLRPRLYWGPASSLRVPLVKCRVCGILRPDDGTRCPALSGPPSLTRGRYKDTTCASYQYLAAQETYDRWRRGDYPSALDETADNGFQRGFKSFQ